MNPPLVFIIVLQYSNSQETLRCLESLKELNYPNYKVVVVDNASSETEINNIKNYTASQSQQSRQPNLLIYQNINRFEIKLLENKENLGYAGGNNVGIKYALANGADFAFILNNDTTVEPDALDKLIAIAESDTQIGIVGPAIREPHPRRFNLRGEKGYQTAYFGKIDWLKPELSHSYLPPADSYLKPKEYIIGAAMLVKKEVLEKIVGFDEIYFLYFEDADFCIRAQLAGFKLKITTEAMVHHKVSSSTKKLGSPLILRYHMRNALIFNSLNAPWTIKPLIIFWAGWILLKNLLKIFIWPEKEAAGEAIIDGVLDFYKNRFGKISNSKNED